MTFSCRFTDVKYEECVLHFFEKCLSCAVEKETFLMDSLKLMIKDSFFAENLKNTEMFIEFFSNLVEDIQVLDLPLKKVLVSVDMNMCKGLLEEKPLTLSPTSFHRNTLQSRRMKSVIMCYLSCRR